MPRTRFSTEQIITKLRQAEVELSRGLRVPQVCKKLGIGEQTSARPGSPSKIRITGGGRSTAGCASTRRSG